MTIPNLHPPRWMPESEALRLESGSLASAIVGRVSATEVNRYTVKRAELCAACRKGKHSSCTSIHCPCERCNKGVL